MRGSVVRTARSLLQGSSSEFGLLAERLASGSLASASSASAGAAASAGFSKADLRTLRTLAREYRQLLEHAFGSEGSALQQARTELSALNGKGLRRYFSSEPPKKGYGNFYPKGKQGGRSQQAKDKAGTSQKADEKAGSKLDFSALGKGTRAQQFKGVQQFTTFALILAAMAFFSSWGRSDAKEVSFQEFKTQLLGKGLVEKLEVSNKTLVKVYIRTTGGGRTGDLEMTQPGMPAQTGPAPHKFYFNVGSVDSFERKMEDAQEDLGWTSDSFVPIVYTNELSWSQEIMRMAPTLLLIAGYVWFTRRQMGGLTGGAGGSRGIFNVGKAQVSTLDKNAKNKIMFKDVAGCDEAKAEIMEFVNFLKSPGKYKELGAHIPKGALLVGPPGTGKTLLAKATAGEANVPFLSISGSDFMEMFVGVGPARVRDLFAQARAQAPSMVFIDEIDAIGRARGKGGFAGGNDERENTLNQLLVEMDGFATTSGVIILGGTNRPDILDKALLRPGRFDRQISIDRPDLVGREHIFRIHMAKLRLDKPIQHYSERMAALTPGFAGADIANVANEAALIAARQHKDAIGMVDFEAAVDRVIGGLEKKTKVISKEERRTVAFHEAGHAVAAWFLQYAEPLLKVSIVPRGAAALGFAQYLPSENMLMTVQQMTDMMCMALGGRAAEQVMLGKISTGAQNDLERITKMAYGQVGLYGMNEKVGLVSFPQRENELTKPYSNETAHLIDTEVRRIISEAYQRTVDLLTEKKGLVTALAERLLDKEVVNVDDLEAILGERPFKSAELRNIDKFRDGFVKDAIDSAPENPPTGSSGSSVGGLPPGVVDVPSAPQEGNIEQPAATPVPGPDSTMKPRAAGRYAS